MNTSPGEFPGQAALITGGAGLPSGGFLPPGDAVVAGTEIVGTRHNAVVRR
jgi:hypothetical protein